MIMRNFPELNSRKSTHQTKISHILKKFPLITFFCPAIEQIKCYDMTEENIHHSGLKMNISTRKKTFKINQTQE